MLFPRLYISKTVMGFLPIIKIKQNFIKKELIVLHTRQFAKRQRTWFNAISEIQWFDADSSNLLDQVWQAIAILNRL